MLKESKIQTIIMKHISIFIHMLNMRLSKALDTLGQEQKRWLADPIMKKTKMISGPIRKLKNKIVEVVTL